MHFPIFIHKYSIRIHFDNKYIFKKITIHGSSLVAQWLGLHAFAGQGPGSIPGRGTKILQAAGQGQENKTKQNKQRKP